MNRTTSLHASILVILLGALLSLQAQATKALTLYFIDVEGGAATLIVTPSGESVLMDAGWSDVAGRDARRIQKAMREAAITRIDHLIVSHYHMDHYGGVPDLAGLVPVGQFYDHGPMSVMTEDDQFEARYRAYQKAARHKSVHVAPGSVIPLKAGRGVSPIMLRIVSSAGQTVMGEARPNAACESLTPQDNTNENGRSVGSLLTWGDFEFLNLADLTWNISQRLVCPGNQLGQVDLYQVTHHGGDASNHPILLRSILPTVAVMINGPRKGGHPETVKSLHQLPSMRGLYQLHRNVTVDPAHNTAPEFIANPEETPDEGHMVAVSVDAETRVFTVTNERTQGRQTYSIR